MSETTKFDRTKYLDWVRRFYGSDVRDKVEQQLGESSIHLVDANTALNRVLREYYKDHINTAHELASLCCAAPPLKRTSFRTSLPSE